jgi:hypothetical protein
VNDGGDVEWCLRLSPHQDNTDDDVAAVVCRRSATSHAGNTD